MARGRKPLPDAIKSLKGNPGKRRLALDSAKPDPAPSPPQTETYWGVEVPDWLTQERERAIFRSIVDDYLQRRIAKASDLPAYARWAALLNRWIEAKLAMDGQLAVYKSESPHGTYWRRHPLSTELSLLEGRLITLEDRLGLNPVARQSIARGFLNAPPSAGGDLFGGESKAAAQDAGDGEGSDGRTEDSPIDYIAGTRH